MKIHEELNEKNTNLDKTNNNQNSNIQINQTNQQEMLYNFWDNFTKNYNSRISTILSHVALYSLS